MLIYTFSRSLIFCVVRDFSHPFAEEISVFLIISIFFYLSTLSFSNDRASPDYGHQAY